MSRKWLSPTEYLDYQGFAGAIIHGTSSTDKVWRLYFTADTCMLCHESHENTNMLCYSSFFEGPNRSEVLKKAWILCPRLKRQMTVLDKEIMRDAWRVNSVAFKVAKEL